MKKRKHYKKLSYYTICICLFLTLYIPSLASEPIWMKKISDEVWNDQGDETGLKKIYVSRFTIDKELVETTFEEKYGYSLKKYENEAIYKMTVVPEVTERVNEKYGSYYAKNEYLGNKAFDDKMTFLDHEILVDYNRHIAEKRSVSKQLYSQSNDLFVAKNQLDTNNIIYAGSYTGSFIMYADDETIEKIAKDETVESVSIWEDATLVSLMNDQSIIKTDQTYGTKSISYNNGNGYKGTDVKIGIIEMGKYDETNPHLSSLHNNSLFYVNTVRQDGTTINPQIEITDATELTEANNHTTAVTSIIVGQSITFKSQTFEGVVPNATVYQTTAILHEDTPLALETLVDNNVSVVNCSIGAYRINTFDYTELDQRNR